MGKFDAEIKKALKIGADWVKSCDKYEARFINLKKANLKWEKEAIATIQDAVKNGVANQKQYLGEIDVIKGRLDDFEKEGKHLYTEFDQWALKEPRSSMGTIDGKLKLGGIKTEAYQAVRIGITTQLTDVASAISKVQRVWNNDVSVAISTQRNRTETLEKIIKGEASKTKGYLDQLNKEIASFKAGCERIATDLKVQSLITDINQLLKGEMDGKDKVVLEQKHHQVTERLKVIPTLQQQITKNYNRVISAVPAGVMDQFTSSAAKKNLEKVFADAKTDLQFATGALKAAKKQFETRKLV